MSDEILFSVVNNAVGKIILNRPHVLNALNTAMFVAMQDQLTQWENNPKIKAVIIRSSVEKAFCAGGDIRAVYENPPEVSKKYFRLEYNVNKLIAHFPKPFIAFLHGITMGGGVGISIHGSHSVAAEDLRWAMPETGIGFFPDVGASYYLSRLPNHIGKYLALTGSIIDATQALHLKLIDAIVSKEKFDALENALAEKISAVDCDITKIIQAFSCNKTTLLNESDISACFQFNSVEKIIDALIKLNSPWSIETLKKLQHASPTSLKVVLHQLQLAKEKAVNDAIEMDYHIACTMLMHHDFFEGIRAAVMDKDKNPKWNPDSLTAINEQMIGKYFA